MALRDLFGRRKAQAPSVAKPFVAKPFQWQASDLLATEHEALDRLLAETCDRRPYHTLKLDEYDTGREVLASDPDGAARFVRAAIPRLVHHDAQVLAFREATGQ